jgi:hypothetical protein
MEEPPGAWTPHQVDDWLEECQEIDATLRHGHLPGLAEHIDAVGTAADRLHDGDGVAGLPENLPGDRQRHHQRALQVQRVGQRATARSRLVPGGCRSASVRTVLASGGSIVPPSVETVVDVVDQPSNVRPAER